MRVKVSEGPPNIGGETAGSRKKPCLCLAVQSDFQGMERELKTGC